MQGSVDDSQEGMVAYLVLNERNDTIGICDIKNGKFLFKGTLVENIAWASVRITNVPEWPVFFLEKSKKIAIEGSVSDWDHASIKGSKETDLLINFKNELKRLENDFKKLNEQAVVDIDNSLMLRATAQEKLDSAFILKMNLIHENPGSSYIAWLIYKTKELSLEQKDLEFNKLKENARYSEFGKSLKKYIDAQRKSGKLTQHSIVPNLKVKLLEGQELYLHELIQKNEITLLDFWASWCWPCREMTPQLRELYDMYKEKGFNLISLSLDKNDKAWEDAVKKDDMYWVNAKASKNEGDLTDIFDIHALPSMLLIDKNGRILAIKNGLSKEGSFGFESGKEIQSLEQMLKKSLIK